MNNIPEYVYHKCEHCRVTVGISTASSDSPKISSDAEGNLIVENLKCTGWLGYPRVPCSQVYSGKVHRTAKDAGYWGEFDESGAGDDGIEI